MERSLLANAWYFLMYKPRKVCQWLHPFLYSYYEYNSALHTEYRPNPEWAAAMCRVLGDVVI